METIKKIKRSISSTNTVQTTVPSGKVEKKQTWIHAPEVLLNGSVTYTLRMVGMRAVSKPKGTDVIRDAIHAIHFHNQTKRAETSHDQAKLQKVDLRINVDGVTILDSKTKELLYRYTLKRISFCSDDKQDKRYLAFIANDGDPSNSTCFVFLSDKMSEEITRTIGEAFDLCYKRYMDTHKLDLQNQKKVLVLRRRIAELEEENQRLSQLLADALKRSNVIDSDPPPVVSLIEAPLLPSSPMPSLPSSPMPSLAPPSKPTHIIPPSSTTSLVSSAPSAAPTSSPVSLLDSILSSGPSSTALVSPSGLLPPPSSLVGTTPVSFSLTSSSSSSSTIVPPPPVPARRSISVTQPSSLAASTPKNGVFDDSFDPRASSSTANGKEHKSKEEYDSMIKAVDAELSGITLGGEFSLEVADAADVFKAMDESVEYAAPRNVVDPKMFNPK